MRTQQKLKWKDVLAKVKNIEGKRPKSEHCVKNAVQRVVASGKKGVAITNYKNCGRHKKLSQKEAKMVVDYVRLWRKKLFCTCPHIKRELKLDCSVTTIARTLNRLLFSFLFLFGSPFILQIIPKQA